MKKLISLIIAAVILAVTSCLLFSCGAENGNPTIGIVQFGSHASLNNCYEGIMNGLAEKGYTKENCNFEYVISNFDGNVSASQAQMMVNKNVDVIIAIATPSAVAAATASDGDIPVVFCAVTDASTMENYENITGSSDIPNFEKQLELVTAFMGKAELKIGVLYSTEESSSPIQVSSLKEAAKKYSGMEVYDSVVSDITTIDTKVNELLSRDVDCFVNLLDNTIVGKLESNILPITNDAGIPVFGSEIEQVKVGCVASASIEYLEVGRSAGLAAAEILGGKSADDIPVSVITSPANYYSSDVCRDLGITVPENIAATDIVK